MWEIYTNHPSLSNSRIEEDHSVRDDNYPLPKPEQEQISAMLTPQRGQTAGCGTQCRLHLAPESPPHLFATCKQTKQTQQQAIPHLRGLLNHNHRMVGSTPTLKFVPFTRVSRHFSHPGLKACIPPHRDPTRPLASIHPTVTPSATSIIIPIIVVYIKGSHHSYRLYPLQKCESPARHSCPCFAMPKTKEIQKPVTSSDFRA